jgi:hypothetical protein
MNQRITFSRLVVRPLRFSIFLLGTFIASPSFGQHCPHGGINAAGLTAEMEKTTDPNVIFRSAAIAGPAVLPVLHRISKPGMSAETAAGAAQVSLGKLGDENALAELNNELNARTTFYAPSRAIQKLLLVGNGRAVAILMTYLVAHPAPVIVGFEVDNPHDLRRGLIIGLADVVENPDGGPGGKYPRTIEEWVDWWTRGKEKPSALSIGSNFHNPYLDCLCRKIEWGFSMAIIDLAATGDARAVPIIQKLEGMGYPYQGYVGSKAPYLWLRHDYVEAALATWGDAEEFGIVAHELRSNAFQNAILKLQIIGGKKAVSALMDADINPGYAMFNHALFPALSRMVQDPPLPADAEPSAENRQKWKDWWLSNKEKARFVKVSPFE